MPRSIKIFFAVVLTVIALVAAVKVSHRMPINSEPDLSTYLNRPSLLPHQHQGAATATSEPDANNSDPVTFPYDTSIVIGESEIDITFRDLVFSEAPPSDLFPANRLANIHAELEERASNGDLRAARMLAEELKKCSFSFSTKEDLDAALGRLAKDNVVSFADGSPDFSVGTNREDKLTFENQLKGDYRYCEGITIDQRKDYRKWGEVAASGGDFAALRFMIANASNISEELYWTEQSWLMTGYVGSLEALAALYLEQQSDARNRVAPNKVKAFAHGLAAGKIWQKYLELDANYQANALYRITDIDQTLSVLSSSLTISEFQEAEGIASEIIETSDHCCTGRWTESFSR